MDNLYICTNGLVFLYFNIVKRHGGILDDGVMQYSSHYCGFFNGKLNPTTAGEKQNTLVSILLIGHSQDYRKISLQMFIAPMYNAATKTLANFTSLAVINSEGECIIEKGKELARIRVRGNTIDDKAHVANPGEEHPTTVCFLDGTTHMGQDPAKIPLEKDTSTLEEVYSALVHDSELKFVGCYQYPFLDQQYMAIIESRMNELSNDSIYIDKTKSELNPQDGAGLKFWTPQRLSTYGDPLGSPDETALASDVTTRQVAYEAALAQKPKDISKIKQAKSELEAAAAKLKLVPYFKKYKELFESAKKYGDDTKADWTIVSDTVKVDILNHTIFNFTYTLANSSAMMYDQRFDQYNRDLEGQIEVVERQSREYSAILHDETLKISPKITKAEVSLARHKTFMTKAKKIMYRVQRVVMDFEISHKSIPDLGNVDEIALDIVVSIKNEGSVNDACLALEREVDQCKFVKPNPKRASQLAMNKLGKGGSWPGTYTDEWRDTVLEFLDKIFSKSCPYLRGNFAKGINGIVKGYLLNEPNHNDWDNVRIAGSPFLNSTYQKFLKNYNVTKKDDLFPDLKPKDATWDDILLGLEECDKDASNENQPLNFQLANTVCCWCGWIPYLVKY
ncbi:unnamed protein product [Orchesella dallaii]|uniref:Uncharacterized protein n=1 Tax=Orchesella dallaii TaxID=48710 RepID=A0ABP1S248_9HEXA